MDYSDLFKNWLQQNAAENETLRSETRETEDTIEPQPLQSQSDIAFETDTLKLRVQKGIHKREKRFKIQDHLFYFKIVPKSGEKMPLLIDILDFLHAAFIHVLDSIKSFYNKGKTLFY